MSAPTQFVSIRQKRKNRKEHLLFPVLGTGCRDSEYDGIAAVKPAPSKCPPDTCICFFEALHRKRKNQKEHLLFLVFWSECRDSNSRPLEPHSSAIPNFATPGNVRLADDFDMITHLVGNCKSFFYFFRFIFIADALTPELLIPGQIFHSLLPDQPVIPPLYRRISRSRKRKFYRVWISEQVPHSS